MLPVNMGIPGQMSMEPNPVLLGTSHLSFSRKAPMTRTPCCETHFVVVFSRLEVLVLQLNSKYLPFYLSFCLELKMGYLDAGAHVSFKMWSCLQRGNLLEWFRRNTNRKPRPPKKRDPILRDFNWGPFGHRFRGDSYPPTT